MHDENKIESDVPAVKLSVTVSPENLLRALIQSRAEIEYQRGRADGMREEADRAGRARSNATTDIVESIFTSFGDLLNEINPTEE